jgi:S-adenosylmethionine:tRNA ribosyltransferase-isomerase
MQVADFDYQLPDELIAQQPSETRGAARLMVLDRSTGEIARGHVDDLPGWLRPADLLVVNNTRVFPARLIGRRLPGGGEVECLLLGRIDANRWDALVHPGHKVRVGRRFVCEGAGGRLDGEVLEEHTFGRRTIGLWAAGDAGVDAVIDRPTSSGPTRRATASATRPCSRARAVRWRRRPRGCTSPRPCSTPSPHAASSARTSPCT